MFVCPIYYIVSKILDCFQYKLFQYVSMDSLGLSVGVNGLFY